MRAGALAAFMLALWASPALAQASPAAPAVPPGEAQIAEMARRYPEYAQGYRQFCTGTPESERPEAARAASAVLAGPPPMRATLDTSGEFAVLWSCVDQLRLARGYSIANIDAALLLMSAREFEPMWQAAEAHWGSDLGLLRAQINQQGAGETEHHYRSMLEGSVARPIELAHTLMGIGDFEGAIAVLEGARVRVEADRRAARGRLDFERVMIALTHAAVLARFAGDRAAADGLLDIMAITGPQDEQYINIVINRAAYLAEAGDHGGALALIEPAFAQFKGAPYSWETYAIGGSDREFLWIMACAHHGLGNITDGARLAAMVSAAPEQPEDEYLAQTKPGSLIRMRMNACMGDAEGWFGEFRGAWASRLGRQWLELQPARVNANGMPRGFAVPEDVAATFAERFRVLPETYHPALRQWRDPAARDSSQ